MRPVRGLVVGLVALVAVVVASLLVAWELSLALEWSDTLYRLLGEEIIATINDVPMRHATYGLLVLAVPCLVALLLVRHREASFILLALFVSAAVGWEYLQSGNIPMSLWLH